MRLILMGLLLLLHQEMSFWFATGGAGFCLSRSMVLKMKPFARFVHFLFELSLFNNIYVLHLLSNYAYAHNSGGKFISLGEKIRLPDDVTIGYIIEYMLGKNLTVVEQFHSHLEPMKYLTPNVVKDHVSNIITADTVPST